MRGRKKNRAKEKEGGSEVRTLEHGKVKGRMAKERTKEELPEKKG